MKGANVKKKQLPPADITAAVVSALGGKPLQILEKRTLYRRGITIASTFQKVTK